MQLINRSVILFLKPWKNKIISSTSTSRLSAASLHFSARQRKSEKGERLPKARGGGDGEASEAKNRAPRFFLVPTHYPVKSLVSCWCPVFLRFPPLVQRLNKNTKIPDKVLEL